jgi:hypothetical protein
VVRSRERFKDDVLYEKAIVRGYGEAERRAQPRMARLTCSLCRPIADAV